MRIVIIILSIFLFLFYLTDEVIYLNKKSDKEASKILYEYVLKEVNMTPSLAYENFGYHLSDVKAVFYDLNSDGVYEIVGYIDVPAFLCVEGMQLFILNKEENNYKVLANVNFYPDKGIKILKSKNDKFSDLKIFYTKTQLFETPKKSIKTIYNSHKIVKYNKKYQQYY